MLFHRIVIAQETTSYRSEMPDAVLLLTATGSIFDQARNELVNELRDEFSISMAEITAKTTIEDIDTLFPRHTKPKAVVLLGNNSIRLYVKYAHQRKETTESIQVVAILALDVERAVSGIANVNAIAYETPMITALVNFRRVTGKPIARVGVLYRKPLKGFVEKHARICWKEDMLIRGIEIGDDSLKHQTEISDALETLLTKEKVEALWIANDDVLLKPKLLGNAWCPALKKKKVPLIVGMESLVDPKLDFGTFAAVPDPVALGEQAAEIIFNLKLDDWNHSGMTIHPAISTYSVLNIKKVSEFVDKKNLKTYEVSKVLNGRK
jgi:hypothetical protein